MAWSQSDANSLTVRWPDKPMEVRRSAGPGSGEVAMAATRIPAGHPEGYIEAFAEVYRNYCLHLLGESHNSYPTIADGVRGMRFIDTVVQSSKQGGVWLDL